jgi:hypothetical protein
MAAPLRLLNPFTRPPSGQYEYSIGDQCVTARSYYEFTHRVVELHNRLKVAMTEDVDTTIARYLCPRLPDGYCSQPSAVKMISIDAIKAKAYPYFTKKIEPRDTIESRLSICANCPCNSRSVCLSCTGLDSWIRLNFRSQRDRMPQDAGVGVCLCAETLAAVVATVAYSADEPVWNNTPDTCWRKANVGRTNA